MNFEYDVYLVFNLDDKESATWAQKFQTHISFLLQRLQKKSISISSNIEDNLSLDKQDKIISRLNNASIVLFQYPLIHYSYGEKLKVALQEVFNAKERKVYSISLTSTEKDNDYLGFEGFSYYRFYYFDNESNSTITLRSEDSKTDKQYWQKLTDLAYDISDILKNFQEKGQKASGKTCIYLAETSDDQIANRDVLHRELTQYNYTVLPEKPLPKDAKSFKKEVEKALKESALSIHLIGEMYGNIIEGSEYSGTELQNKIAVEYVKNSGDLSLLPRLIWILPHIKSKDARQQKFIENMERNPEELTGGEIIQTPIEVLKTIIRNKISSSLQNNTERAEEDKQSVYVIHENKEDKNLTSIISCLENKNIKVITSESALTEDKIVSIHRKNLATCDAIMIVYNTHNPFWLDSKLRDLLKAPGYGRSKPFLAKALLLEVNSDPPPTLFTKDLIILKQKKGFSKDILEPFIKKILP